MKKGGINVPDIYSKVKAQEVMWITRLMNTINNDENIFSQKSLSEKYLYCIGGISCVKSNFNHVNN